MANHRNRFPARRRFLKQSTALTATMVALPHLARAAEPSAPDDLAQPTTPAPATVTAKETVANTLRGSSLRHATRRTREPGR